MSPVSGSSRISAVFWLLLSLMCLLPAADCKPVDLTPPPGLGRVIISSEELPVREIPVFTEKQGLQEDGSYLLGDVRINPRRQAVPTRSRLWPGGIVPYIIDPAFNAEERRTIERAMKEIEQNVGTSSQPCVQFVPRSQQVNYLEAQSGNGCSSHIGLESVGAQVSTFAKNCVALKGIIIHELLHTLGLYHEQDRYDRDLYIRINDTNLLDSARRDYERKNRSQIDTLGTAYDFSSIMHYGPFGFAKDDRYPVMTPLPEFARGLWMGQRNALSRIDVLRIQRLYGCREDTSHMQSDISEENRLAWCNFDDGICDFTTSITFPEDDPNYTADGSNSNLYWMVTSKPTLDGPKAGFTNGLDAFFYASTKYYSDSAESTTNSNVDVTVPSHSTVEPHHESGKPEVTESTTNSNVDVTVSSYSTLQTHHESGQPEVTESATNSNVDVTVPSDSTVDPQHKSSTPDVVDIPEISVTGIISQQSSLHVNTDTPNVESSNLASENNISQLDVSSISQSKELISLEDLDPYVSFSLNTSSSLNTFTSDTVNSWTEIPGKPTASSPAPASTKVSLLLPMLTTEVNSTCLDYHVYQAGPASYLTLYISGPLIPRVLVHNHYKENNFRDRWFSVILSLAIPTGVQFQLEFVSVLTEGSVALDNVHILKGACQ